MTQPKASITHIIIYAGLIAAVALLFTIFLLESVVSKKAPYVQPYPAPQAGGMPADTPFIIKEEALTCTKRISVKEGPVNKCNGTITIVNAKTEAGSKPIKLTITPHTVVKHGDVKQDPPTLLRLKSDQTYITYTIDSNNNAETIRY